MNKIRLIVTATFGLEAIVRRELEDMGFSGISVLDGKLEFEALVSDIPRLNINLRAADRVLVKVGEFPADDFGKLFDGTKVLPWENWLPYDAKLTVIGKCVRSKLLSVRSCQSIAHKAVVERLKKELKTDTLPETGAEFTIQVALLKDIAQLTLDTSGLGLHKRGYRVGTGEVPLRENLAAALVMLSFWGRGRLLVDPMCGSGTILIEAAMLLRNIAPGLNREFAAEHWPVVEPEFWVEARERARAAVRPSGDTIMIRGFDIDPERVKDTRANARQAGVERDISVERRDIAELSLEEQYGVVISNPPYGVKLGDPKELTPLYTALDNAFGKRAGWSLYILTSDLWFPNYIKRGKPDKVRKLFNGTIAVNYYQYYGERPPVDQGNKLNSPG